MAVSGTVQHESHSHSTQPCGLQREWAGAVSKAFALPTQEFEFNSQYVSSLGEAEGNPTAGRWKQGRSGAH